MLAILIFRYCLWILGNERTLVNSESIWEDLVLDAKKRESFFNADEDKDIAKAILEVKTEFDQLDHLLDGSSILFKSAMWKVHNYYYLRRFLPITYCCYGILLLMIFYTLDCTFFLSVSGSFQ